MGLRGSAPRRGMSAAARRVPTRSAPCIPHGLRAQDAGNASPSAVGIVLVVAVLLCTIAAGARIAMARAQARTAADMSALSTWGSNAIHGHTVKSISKETLFCMNRHST